MASRKDEVVLRLRTGIETLLRANSIDLVRGTGTIAGPNTIKIAGAEAISAKNIKLAIMKHSVTTIIFPMSQPGNIKEQGNCPYAISNHLILSIVILASGVTNEP